MPLKRLLNSITVLVILLSMQHTATAGWLDDLFSDSPGVDMVRIEGGRFDMGSPRFEKGRRKNEVMHAVTVQPFLIARHETTVGEFRRFIEATGYKTDAVRKVNDYGCYGVGDEDAISWQQPGFKQTDDHPVVCVSWNDAMAYTEWLRQQSGKPFRLPTEAEWEFAARGGVRASRFWGEDPKQACEYANVDGESYGCKDGYAFTAPVGKYRPNPYGLKDMLGNVAEWTCSWHGDYNNNPGKLIRQSARTQGRPLPDGVSLGLESSCDSMLPEGLSGSLALIGIKTPKFRSVRGGSWDNNYPPSFDRSAARLGLEPVLQLNFVGFRLAQDI